jgi:hypothetical protein
MPFRWNAEQSVMVPLRKAYADRTFVDGEEYRLGIIEERSAASHSHFFAALNDAWMNLNEEDSIRFPSVDILRSHALIKTGFSQSQEYICNSKAEAVRLASFLQRLDDYSVVVVSGSAVQRMVARSQAYRSMGKAEFEASKQAVLDYVAGMIGVTTKSLKENAE